MHSLIRLCSAMHSLYRKKVREHASLKKLEGISHEYFNLLAELEENRTMMDDPDMDQELVEMARDEIAVAEKRIPVVEKKVLEGLLPEDPADAKNAVVEIRAGTGGDEAALFAAVLFRMYSRYCDQVGWKISVIDSSETELGGYKEIVFTVIGDWCL